MSRSSEKDIIERVEILIKHLSISKAEFARQIGVAPQNLSAILNGKRPFGEGVLNKILLSFDNIQKKWFLTGEGEMISQAKQEAKIINFTDYNIKLVPLVSQYAYAGYLNGFADTEYIESLPTVPLLATHEPKGNYIAFEVAGDSMDNGTSDSLQHGDVIICREISCDLWKYKLHINKWKFVIVHKTEGILVKNIIDHDVDTANITIHSLNPDPRYPDMNLNLNEVSKLFNVIQINRSQK